MLLVSANVGNTSPKQNISIRYIVVHTYLDSQHTWYFSTEYMDRCFVNVKDKWPEEVTEHAFSAARADR